MIPRIRGLIRRRVLVTFRVDADVMQRQLPAPFRPKLLGGDAVAGICLIRLERARPLGLPLPVGAASENAAHRVAVEWEDASGHTREGVYVTRRDSDSRVARLLGGRVFPGELHPARFAVRESADALHIAVRSDDGRVAIALRARPAPDLPATSRFASLEAASAFFAAGALGYSPRRCGGALEGLRLDVPQWSVEPLAVDHVSSSHFADERLFPPGSVAFDCALLMRDAAYEFRALRPLVHGPLGRPALC